VPQLIWRRGDEIVLNPESKKMSSFFLANYPERFNSYYFKGKKIAKVTVSRGCFNKCAFCAVHKCRNFVVRSIPKIAEELEYLLKIGVEIVDFEDDNLFYNSEWSMEFLEMLTTYHKRGLSYSAMNGITAPNLVPFAEQAIEAGFIEFNLSLVSTDFETRKAIERPDFFDSIRKIAEITNGRIEILVFLILGLPENSPESILQDILGLAKLPVKIGVSPLYLIPGIPIFDKMGLPTDRRLMRGTALYKFGENFTREMVIALWKLTRMINFCKEKNFENIDEELEFFEKSLKEKIWYTKTKNGAWKKSGIAIPENFPGGIILDLLTKSFDSQINVNFDIPSFL